MFRTAATTWGGTISFRPDQWHAFIIRHVAGGEHCDRVGYPYILGELYKHCVETVPRKPFSNVDRMSNLAVDVMADQDGRKTDR